MYTTKFKEEDEENTFYVPVGKPRNKKLNEVLLSRPGGKMKNPKDVSRMKAKQDLRRQCYEEV